MKVQGSECAFPKIKICIHEIINKLMNNNNEIFYLIIFTNKLNWYGNVK